MATVLGLAGLVVFIVGVIMLAAAVTWAVAKFSPQRRQKADPSP
jgi:membrane-bound ClpP family serine protease